MRQACRDSCNMAWARSRACMEAVENAGGKDETAGADKEGDKEDEEAAKTEKEKNPWGAGSLDEHLMKLFPTSTLVKIKGLQKNTNFNGKHGHVTKIENGVIIVRLLNIQKVVSVYAVNIEKEDVLPKTSKDFTVLVGEAAVRACANLPEEMRATTTYKAGDYGNIRKKFVDEFLKEFNPEGGMTKAEACISR